jgi:uncharacterized protein YecT (DUF1311 family)
MVSSRGFVIGIVAFGFASSATFAQEAKLSQTYETCMEKSGGVTSNMLDCAAAETDIQDKRLNKAYQELLKSVTSKRQIQLREAQRRWLAFRKANCEFYADPDGGTSSSLAASSCFLSATANRAKELEDLKD